MNIKRVIHVLVPLWSGMLLTLILLLLLYLMSTSAKTVSATSLLPDSVGNATYQITSTAAVTVYLPPESVM